MAMAMARGPRLSRDQVEVVVAFMVVYSRYRGGGGDSCANASG